MSRKVYVVGVGMTPFTKPETLEHDYPDLAGAAVRDALADARIDYEAIEQAAVGYVYGDSGSGQRALYEVGLSGVPVINVNNNCASGSTALFITWQLIAGGLADCGLALGFELMKRGSLGGVFDDRANPGERHFRRMAEQHGFAKAPATAQLYGNAGLEHMKRFGTTAEHFAMVGAKNHRHSEHNPRAQFRTPWDLDAVLASPTIFGPLTKLQCSPTSDGAAAAVLMSEEAVRRCGLQDQAVEILSLAMMTDRPASFQRGTIDVVGADMAKNTAQKALTGAGVTVDEVQVIELHDCFSVNELLTYEALGLCPEGEGGRLIEEGQTTYGGRWVVNPSGGLISKGHPLGATGLAQCAELCWQLRGEAGPRQVEGAEVALQHNLGLGGACVVGIYARR